MKQCYIKLLVTGLFYLKSVASFSQTPWYLNGNGSTNPTTDFVGTTDNNGLAFRTNNTLRALITTGGTFGSGTTQGDGLRIVDPLLNGTGNLDLWTSSSTQTHIRWNGSGLIQGMNSRFEIKPWLVLSPTTV